MNFKQSAIFSIAASFGLLVLNMLINVIESRVLGPAEIGRYQVFITTQTLFATFCALGIGQSCIYFINALKVEESKVLTTTINVMLPIAIVAGLTLFILVKFNPDYFGRENIYSIVLFCLGTSAILVCNIFTPVLLAKMEVVKNQIVKYSSRIFTFLVLLLGWLCWDCLDVGFLLGLTGFANIFSLVLLYSYFSKRFTFCTGINKVLFVNILKWGIKLAGNNIASLILLNIPIYFLTWFSVKDGFFNVGYYSRANSILVIGTIIASSIGPLLYSKWSMVNGFELKSQVRKVSMLLVFANIVIACGLIIFAPYIVDILYGNDFRPTIPILRILSLSLIVNGLKEICYGILSSQGAPVRILKNLLIGIILSVILNYFIIPSGGVIGCAIVTIVVSFVTVGLLQLDIIRITQVSLSDFYVLPTKKNIYSLNFFKKR